MHLDLIHVHRMEGVWAALQKVQWEVKYRMISTTCRQNPEH